MNPKKAQDTQDSGYGLSESTDRRKDWSCIAKTGAHGHYCTANKQISSSSLYRWKARENEEGNRVKREETQGLMYRDHEIHAKLE